MNITLIRTCVLRTAKKKKEKSLKTGPNRELNPGPRTSWPQEEAGANPKRVSYY